MNDSMNLSFREIGNDQIKWDKDLREDSDNKQKIMTGKFTANGKDYVITVKYSSELDISTEKKVHETLQNEFKQKFENKEIDTQGLASLAGKSIRFNANQERKWELLNEKEELDTEFNDPNKIFNTISTLFSKSFGVEISKKEESSKDKIIEEEEEDPEIRKTIDETEIRLEKQKKTEDLSGTEVHLEKKQNPRETILECLNEQEKKQFQQVETLIKNRAWLEEKKRGGGGEQELQRFHQALLNNMIYNRNDFTWYVKLESGFELTISSFLGQNIQDAGEIRDLLTRGQEISPHYLTASLCHLSKKHQDVEIIEYNNPLRTDKGISYEKKLNIKEPKKIIMPFWVSSGHFFLYTYDVKKNELKRYDSAPHFSKPIEQHNESAAQVIKEMLKSQKKPVVIEEKVPNQVMNDCGMHTYKNAESFLKGTDSASWSLPNFLGNLFVEKEVDFNSERFNMLMAALGEDPVKTK